MLSQIECVGANEPFKDLIDQKFEGSIVSVDDTCCSVFLDGKRYFFQPQKYTWLDYGVQIEGLFADDKVAGRISLRVFG